MVVLLGVFVEAVVVGGEADAVVDVVGLAEPVGAVVGLAVVAVPDGRRAVVDVDAAWPGAVAVAVAGLVVVAVSGGVDVVVSATEVVVASSALEPATSVVVAGWPFVPTATGRSSLPLPATAMATPATIRTATAAAEMARRSRRRVPSADPRSDRVPAARPVGAGSSSVTGTSGSGGGTPGSSIRVEGTGGAAILVTGAWFASFMGLAMVVDEALGGLSLDELARRIVTGAAEMAAFQAAWLAAVAEFDERRGWERDELRSMAHWLSWRCGVDLRTAREHVRVAGALVRLPVLSAAFAEGRLSYSKVRAATRVATAENEAMVMEWASTLTASQLETVVTAYAKTHAAPLTPEDEAARRARCGVMTWTDRDGLHHTEIVSAPEDGRVIDLALDYGRDEQWKATGSSARGPGGRLDALLLVLRRGLVNAERGVLDESRHLLVTHVRDAAAWVSDDGMIDLDGTGRVVHPRVLQRLGCDAMVQPMLEGADGRPLDLGRRVRTATRDQKIALMAEHRHCAFAGCTVRSKDCEFHHLEFWEHGGRSDLSNFRPLCARHHRAVHDGGWRLVLDDRGGVVSVPPDGRPAATAVAGAAAADVPASASASALVASNRRRRVLAGDAPPSSGVLDSLGGVTRGERMTNWMLGSIVDSLVALGPPAGAAAGDDDGTGHGGEPPFVDRRLVGESPPSPN